MPPCALAELHDWIEPLAASVTPRAGARGRERGREPGGTAADHEHVGAEPSPTRRIVAAHR